MPLKGMCWNGLAGAGGHRGSLLIKNIPPRLAVVVVVVVVVANETERTQYVIKAWRDGLTSLLVAFSPE